MSCASSQSWGTLGVHERIAAGGGPVPRRGRAPGPRPRYRPRSRSVARAGLAVRLVVWRSIQRGRPRGRVGQAGRSWAPAAGVRSWQCARRRLCVVGRGSVGLVGQCVRRAMVSCAPSLMVSASAGRGDAASSVTWSMGCRARGRRCSVVVTRVERWSRMSKREWRRGGPARGAVGRERPCARGRGSRRGLMQRGRGARWVFWAQIGFIGGASDGVV